MPAFVMTPITEDELRGREIFDTGVSMIGLKGQDWICGHCGHQMMKDIDVWSMKVELVFRCGACGGLNERSRPGA